LRFFNATYRARRIQAQGNGEVFMSYSAARSRLQKALAHAAAGETASLITQVFGS
jgi:hypothetical protein